MNKNKGFIGIGLILVIVLGVAVVGGGAYYLGKNSSSIPSYMPDKDCGFNGEKCIDKNKNLQQVEQDQNAQAKLTTYNSTTYGYSIGYSGIDSKNVYITGDGKNINLFPNQSNIDTIEIIDPSTFDPSPNSIYIGTVTFGNNQYKKFKDKITPRHTTYLMSGLKNNKSMFIYVENDSDNPNYLDLSSLKIDTINSNKVDKTDPYNRYVSSDCKILTGCNGPINCVDKSFNENGGTTCQFLPEYACYKISSIRCEKQISGKCDWTNSPELNSCVNTARSN